MPRRAFSVPWRVRSFTYRLLSDIKRLHGSGAGVPWHPPTTQPQCSPTTQGARGGSPPARSSGEGRLRLAASPAEMGRRGEGSSGFLQNFLPSARMPRGA